MKRYKYQVLLTLFPPERGGLEDELPCCTRRLVVRARHHETQVSQVFSSIMTTTDDQPLHPGDAHIPVTMQLLCDDAGDYFGPGEQFALWFGDDVGYGVVSRQMFT